MRILVDTNVLLRLARRHEPHTAIADQALVGLRDQGNELRIVPQIMYEFWVVGTRPIDQNGLGFTTDVIDADVSRFMSMFQVLRDERGILDPWKELVRNYNCQGKQAHDARLVAAMQRHGLTHILTFNVSDFKRYGEIAVIDPHQVAAI